jgi:hypothetical protein
MCRTDDLPAELTSEGFIREHVAWRAAGLFKRPVCSDADCQRGRDP